MIFPYSTPMDTIQKTLVSLGLTEKEAAMYLLLLQVGTSPASVLAKRTGLIRSTAHYTCQQLVKKGLASKVMKNTVFLFSAEPPAHLSFLLEKKKQLVKRDEGRLEAILHQLERMVNPHSALPQLRFFEGRDGIINAYRQVIDEMKEGGEIVGYLCPNFLAVDAYFPQSTFDQFIKARVKKNVSARIIALPTPSAFNLQRADAESLRQTRIVESIPSAGTPVEILIYNDKICSTSIEKNVCFASIMQHTAITTMHRAMFELSWKAAALEEQKQPV